MTRALIDAGYEPTLTRKLGELVLRGDPLELQRLRVRELARRWSEPAERVLALALHSTRIGLLTLSWDVICPHCRGVRIAAARLRELPPEASCEACDVVFTTEDARRVEVTFHVHPSVRRVLPRVYCAADAANKPHVWFQLRVPAGRARRVKMHLRAGRYALRLRETSETTVLEIDPSRREPAELRAPESLRERARCGPDITFTLAAGRDDAIYTLEALEWADVVSPGDVLSLGAYHDLFADDSVASDVRLEVGEQTILFTDVVGSTALYHKLGDHRAFAAIKAHFDEVFALVEGAGGVVIKTVGDSVMAAFHRPAAAWEAALAIQRASLERPELTVRASLSRGPCLAVNFNTGLDFFGAVVNEAAKLQSLAGPGQIAVAASLSRDEEVARSLDARAITWSNLHIASGVPPLRAGLVTISAREDV